ncbi:hypothetical protein M8J76_004346 [Diaphorina citri]|nr:hypothetical protein M8J76_004346 [Diaphorina citri]
MSEDNEIYTKRKRNLPSKYQDFVVNRFVSVIKKPSDEEVVDCSSDIQAYDPSSATGNNLSDQVNSVDVSLDGESKPCQIPSTTDGDLLESPVEVLNPISHSDDLPSNVNREDPSVSSDISVSIIESSQQDRYGNGNNLSDQVNSVDVSLDGESKPCQTPSTTDGDLLESPVEVLNPISHSDDLPSHVNIEDPSVSSDIGVSIIESSQQDRYDEDISLDSQQLLDNIHPVPVPVPVPVVKFGHIPRFQIPFEDIVEDKVEVEVENIVPVSSDVSQIISSSRQIVEPDRGVIVCNSQNDQLVLGSTQSDVPGGSCSSDKQTSSSLTACTFCGKRYVHVNKHISSAHPEEYRKRLANKYVSNSNNGNTSERDQSEIDKNEIEKDIAEWSRKDWNHMDLDVLNEHVGQFQAFLKNAIHKLPGPKHPAVMYYEKRKNKSNVASQNGRYKNTTNPQRKTKRDRKKRKESYIYETVQFQYYNCRKKAVRKVIEEEARPCPIKMETMINHYKDTIGLPNNNFDDQISHGDSVSSDDCDDISQEDVDEAVNSMNMDSSSGPDGVLTRAVKIKGVNIILHKIFNRMLILGKVVPCLKLGRTIFLDKGGNVDEVKNWRPITILPILRRMFERILEKRLRDYVIINPNQRGFISKPGCSINITICEKALETAKHEKSDLVCLFLDINNAYNNIGHTQLSKSLDCSNTPEFLKNIIMDCQSENRIVLEIGHDKSSSIEIKQGLMQGAPLSPLLYNVATNHIIDEITEEGLVNNLGVKIVDGVKMLAQAFADDICLLCKSVDAAQTMYNMIDARLKKLGMSLNPMKTQAIVMIKGILDSQSFLLNDTIITPATAKF